MGTMINISDITAIEATHGPKCGAIQGNGTIFNDTVHFIGQIVAVMTLDTSKNPSIEHSIFKYADQVFCAAAFADVYGCDDRDIVFCQVGNMVGVIYVNRHVTQINMKCDTLANDLKEGYAQFHNEDQIYRYGEFWKMTFIDQPIWEDDINVMSKRFKLMKKHCL